jgi:hypothetical protein
MARQIANWQRLYIGVPFHRDGRDIVPGLDCWGLVYRVYFDVLGVELPKWDTVTAKHLDDVNDTISRERSSPEWQSVPLEEAKEFDVVEMRGVYWNDKGDARHGRVHCGLIVWGCFVGGVVERRVLHCERATGVVSVPLVSLMKRDPLAYRHRSQR